ncbi:unnamed protein product [Leptosia nina]|uniref:Uncharacterized protein n=1 Tax=Leptosia nina TaxID=320188 RepID=A0AAV1JJY2_9NEOP
MKAIYLLFVVLSVFLMFDTTNGNKILVAAKAFKKGRMDLMHRGMYDRAVNNRGEYAPPPNTYPLPPYRID